MIWQHDETARTCVSNTSPGPRWYQVGVCMTCGGDGKVSVMFPVNQYGDAEECEAPCPDCGHLAAKTAPTHGDNCFVSNQYEGDPGNQCNCGKGQLE